MEGNKIAPKENLAELKKEKKRFEFLYTNENVIKKLWNVQKQCFTIIKQKFDSFK